MSPTKQHDETEKDSITPDFLREHGISPEEQQQMESSAYSGAADDIAQREGFYSGDDLKNAEEDGSAATAGTSADQREHDQLFRTGRSEQENQSHRGIRARFSAMSSRRKYAVSATLFGGIALLVGALFGLTSLVSVFRLDHFLNNIESKAFTRYQVDMEGRSSKWIKAYIVLRLSEISPPGGDKMGVAPENRDHLLFRSNSVDTNTPVKDWYRTLRASKFEEQLAEKYGMKFTSVAIRENDMVKFRPGVVRIDDRQINIRLSDAEIKAIENFDVNDLNGRLREFVDVDVFDNDADGRRMIRKIVKDETKSWQFVKRYYLRKSIQNMTGIRDWKFFENKRNELKENRISVRNKLIMKALPDSTRMGKIAQCVFGISSCRGSPDPNNPENQSDAARGLATSNIDADSPDKIQQAILKSLNLAGKLAGPAAVVFLTDTLYRVDQSIQNGSLVNAVYSAKMAQSVGLFTQFGIARDQVHTGEMVDQSEVNEFMQIVDYAGKSEGWNSVVQGNTVTGGKAKEEQCKPDNRTPLEESAQTANNTSGILYHCPQDMIGGADRAQFLQSAWNNTIGFVLGPIFTIYESIPGLSQAVGAILGAASAVIDPLIQEFLSAVGAKDDVENLVNWGFKKALEFLGAGPLVGADAPAALYTNQVIQGAAGSAESMARFSGAAATTDVTRARAQQQVAAWQQQENSSQGLWERYLALDNPTSFASQSLFAASSPAVSGGNVLNGFASALINAPWTIMSGFAKAAPSTGYEAAQFGGVRTYDLPAECTESNPLNTLGRDSPARQTNADDKGLISVADLSWDLLQDSTAFYSKLYELNPDKSEEIDLVYNCAVFDSIARGSLAGSFAPSMAGLNAIDETSGSSSSELGSLGEIVVTSYNTRSATLNNTEYDDKDDRRMQGIANLIAERGMAIVGTQETRKPERSGLLKYLPDNYKATELKGALPNTIGVSSVVFYDTNLFKEVDYGTYRMPMQGGLARSAIWTRLQAHTGPTVLVFNFHASLEAEGRTEGARILLEMYDKVRKPGEPVVVMGDMNSNDTDPGRTQIYDAFQRSGKLIYTRDATTKRIGYNCDTHNSPQDGKQDCRNGKGSHIDQVWVSKGMGIDVKSWENIANAQTLSLSDHNPVQTNLSFPGFDGTSGDAVSVNGFTFPLLISREQLLKGSSGSVWCWQNTANCHHHYNAADIFAPTGTVVVAAKPGTVVSAKDNDGSSVGSRVTIKGDDGKLYYYTHMGDGTIKVKERQRVKGGSVLGKVGTSDDAVGTDSHLHIDILPSRYNARPSCSSESCMSYPFIDIQPILAEVFKSVK